MRLRVLGQVAVVAARGLIRVVSHGVLGAVRGSGNRRVSCCPTAAAARPEAYATPAEEVALGSTIVSTVKSAPHHDDRLAQRIFVAAGEAVAGTGIDSAKSKVPLRSSATRAFWPSRIQVKRRLP